MAVTIYYPKKVIFDPNAANITTKSELENMIVQIGISYAGAQNVCRRTQRMQ